MAAVDTLTLFNCTQCKHTTYTIYIYIYIYIGKSWTGKQCWWGDIWGTDGRRGWGTKSIGTEKGPEIKANNTVSTYCYTHCLCRLKPLLIPLITLENESWMNQVDEIMYIRNLNLLNRPLFWDVDFRNQISLFNTSCNIRNTATTLTLNISGRSITRGSRELLS
jgi:hypothetical protein